jgi:hypothetical protein
MRRQVATYVTEEEFQQLARQAARRKVSLSCYVKEHLLQAQEGGSDTPREGEPLEAIVTAAEKRFNDGVERAIARALKPLTQKLGMVTAMLDQFALSMLINLPEIAANQKEQALDAGERRHRGWRRAVEQLFNEMHPEAVANDHGVHGNGARA